MPFQTRVYIVFHPDPAIRDAYIDALLDSIGRENKISLLASAEIFARVSVNLQVTLFQKDETRKQNGIRVLRLAPGCACCSSKLVLSTHLSRLFRFNQPHVLIFELDSQSHPDQVFELLKESQWMPWVGDVQLYTHPGP